MIKKLAGRFALFLGAVAMGVTAWATPTVTITRVQQQYPWEDGVVVEYTVAGEKGATEAVKFYATINNVVREVTVVATDGATDLLSEGTHAGLWTPEKDLKDTEAALVAKVIDTAEEQDPVTLEEVVALVRANAASTATILDSKADSTAVATAINDATNTLMRSVRTLVESSSGSSSDSMEGFIMVTNAIWQAFAQYNGTGGSSGSSGSSSTYPIYLGATPIGPFYLTYDLDGGEMPSGTEAPGPSAYFATDDTFTLVNPIRPNATTGGNDLFLGWTGPGISEPTNVVTLVRGSQGDRTYTANWDSGVYTITYQIVIDYNEVTEEEISPSLDDSDSPFVYNLTDAWSGANGTYTFDLVAIKNHMQSTLLSAFTKDDTLTIRTGYPGEVKSNSTTTQTKYIYTPNNGFGTTTAETSFLGFVIYKWTATANGFSTSGNNITIPSGTLSGDLTLTAHLQLEYDE